MVQDQFSRPLFCVASAFWVYRGSVSVEQRHCLCGTETVSVWNGHSVCVDQTQCLCGTHTMSVWDTHSVSVWDTHSPGWRAGGSRTTPTPHWGFPVPPHTSKIAIPQLRGDKKVLLLFPAASLQPRSSLHALSFLFLWKWSRLSRIKGDCIRGGRREYNRAQGPQCHE